MTKLSMAVPAPGFPDYGAAVARDENTGLRARSGGGVIDGDRLTCFLYELLRDHLPAGTVEGLVRSSYEADGAMAYTNGWLADYARDLACRLREGPPPRA